MNIDELTVGQVKQLQSMLGSAQVGPGPYQGLVGKAVFIRTVTMHYVGRLKSAHDHELVLTECSWVADSGRFHDALRDGKLSEVEPYVTEEVIIGRGGILDVSEWRHEIPKEQK